MGLPQKGNIEIQKGRGQYDGFTKRVKTILTCGSLSGVSGSLPLDSLICRIQTPRSKQVGNRMCFIRNVSAESKQRISNSPDSRTRLRIEIWSLPLRSRVASIESVLSDSTIPGNSNTTKINPSNLGEN